MAFGFTAIGFLILLGAQLTASVRISDSEGGPGIGDVDLDGSIDGVAHVTLKKSSPSQLLREIPGELYYMLEKLGLRSEYDDLIKDIGNAGKGRFGNWKSSEVDRALYVGGHEAVFQAKQVSVYLTKRVNEHGDSTLKLYFVDRTEQPTYVPDNIYSDGDRVTADGDGRVEVMPHGVLAQSFGTELVERRTIETMKSDIQVNLLRFLEKKDAASLYDSFAAAVNSGEQSNLMAAKAVRDFQARFRSKGIGIFFCQVHKRSGCGISQAGSPWAGRYCPQWHMWLEYADLAVAPSYEPSDVYQNSWIAEYEMCMSGNAKPFIEHLRARAVNSYVGSCSEIFGAMDRSTADSYGR